MDGMFFVFKIFKGRNMNRAILKISSAFSIEKASAKSPIIMEKSAVNNESNNDCMDKPVARILELKFSAIMEEPNGFLMFWIINSKTKAKTPIELRSLLINKPLIKREAIPIANVIFRA